MNTLKQLQEKGEGEFRNKFFVLYDSDMSGMGTDQVDNVLDFLHQQTTLAFEAGEEEVIAMVLKEIEKQKSEYNYETQDEWDGYRYAKQEIIDTLKTKLKAKE